MIFLKEACEISSIAMEFLIWPWIDEILDKDSEQYKFSHLEDTIISIPYRACIDEFQHCIYSYPDMTSKQRKEKWLEIEKKYMPFTLYDGNEYLEHGNLWQQQSHLFKFPFYYIDYALAQIYALQIWRKAQVSREGAWKTYLEICNRGGSISFFELLSSTNISSPFDEIAFLELIDTVREWIKDYEEGIIMK